MGPHETKKLLHDKWSPDLRGSPQNGKKSLPAIHLTGLITRIYREFKKLNSQKISDQMKKWTDQVNRAFSKEEVQMTKKRVKKCSISLAYKRNANQNHLKIPPYSC
jgi:hypothetical protein